MRKKTLFYKTYEPSDNRLKNSTNKYLKVIKKDKKYVLEHLNSSANLGENYDGTEMFIMDALRGAGILINGEIVTTESEIRKLIAANPLFKAFCKKYSQLYSSTASFPLSYAQNGNLIFSQRKIDFVGEVIFDNEHLEYSVVTGPLALEKDGKEAFWIPGFTQAFFQLEKTTQDNYELKFKKVGFTGQLLKRLQLQLDSKLKEELNAENIKQSLTKHKPRALRQWLDMTLNYYLLFYDDFQASFGGRNAQLGNQLIKFLNSHLQVGNLLFYKRFLFVLKSFVKNETADAFVFLAKIDSLKAMFSEALKKFLAVKTNNENKREKLLGKVDFFLLNQKKIKQWVWNCKNT